MTATSICWSNLSEGDAMPEYSREITRTTIVSTAISSRDFQTVHHDHEAAQKEGAKDIFLNILSTGGIIGKYLTGWSGSTGKIKDLEIKLGATVFPGDVLKGGGKIIKKYKEGNECLVDIEYGFSVDMGPHAWGMATMVLPEKE